MPNVATALRVLVLIGALSCDGRPREMAAVQPVRRDIESALTTNGRVQIASEAAVHVPSEGRIGKILVRRGETVRQGQVILELLDSGQAAAAEQASARLEAAEARVALLDAGPDPDRSALLRAERAKLEAERKQTREDLRRLERLVERQAAPRAELAKKSETLAKLEIDLEAANARLNGPVSGPKRDELLAAVREARVALRDAERNLANLTVRAPRAGSVYSLRAAEGDYVSHGELVARIGELQEARVRILVDEPELGRVSLGAVARLTADAYPGEEWECPIDELATEIVEVGTRRVGEVRCTSQNPDGRLLPNLAVGVRIVTARVASALSVPRAAIQSDRSGRAFAWTVADGRATRRPVELGVVGPVHVEIRTGLSPSDTVLLLGAPELVEGQRVRARTESDYVDH